MNESKEWVSTFPASIPKRASFTASMVSEGMLFLVFARLAVHPIYLTSELKKLLSDSGIWRVYVFETE